MYKVINLFDFKQKLDYKTEILSGLTVALALVPEAVAFAFIAGLSPLVGLCCLCDGIGYVHFGWSSRYDFRSHWAGL